MKSKFVLKLALLQLASFKKLNFSRTLKRTITTDHKTVTTSFLVPIHICRSFGARLKRAQCSLLRLA